MAGVVDRPDRLLRAQEVAPRPGIRVLWGGKTIEFAGDSWSAVFDAASKWLDDVDDSVVSVGCDLRDDEDRPAYLLHLTVD